MDEDLHQEVMSSLWSRLEEFGESHLGEEAETDEKARRSKISVKQHPRKTDCGKIDSRCSNTSPAEPTQPAELETKKKKKRKNKHKRKDPNEIETGKSLVIADDSDKRHPAESGSASRVQERGWESRPDDVNDDDAEGIEDEADAADEHDSDFDEDDDEFSDFEEAERQASRSKHLQRIKDALGITAEDVTQLKLEKERKNNPTASRKGSNKNEARRKRPAPEVVVFEDPAKRKERAAQKMELKMKTSSLQQQQQQQQQQQHEAREDSDEEDGHAFDLKRARHDVRRFGIDGMSGQSKEQSMADLLVGLGAKKPKNKCENYKELMEMKKREKEAEEAKQSLVGARVKHNRKKRPKRDKNDPGTVDGQIGTYKKGVQVISSHDISKVKANKSRGRRSR